MQAVQSSSFLNVSLYQTVFIFYFFSGSTVAPGG